MSTPAPEGFAEFVSDSSRRLLRAAWLLTGDWASAEDLVQTALATSWTHWRAAAAAPEAYTRTVLTRTFLRWRSRRWNGEVPTALLPETIVEDRLDAVVTRRDLAACLRVLPPQQRAAVVLRYFVDLSEADTALALGCSAGAVKSHTSRALARLRQEPGVASILTGGESS